MKASPKSVTAIIIAGGRGTRLGGSQLGDKARFELAGRSLLAATLASIDASVNRVVVGPRIALDEHVDYWTQETPPGAGPLAALAAGIELVKTDRVLVFGGDMPQVGDASAALLAALEDSVTAVLIDHYGRRNYLAAAWQTETLRTVLGQLATTVNQPLSRLYGGEVAEIVDRYGWGADVDEPQDVTSRGTCG